MIIIDRIIGFRLKDAGDELKALGYFTYEVEMTSPPRVFNAKIHDDCRVLRVDRLQDGSPKLIIAEPQPETRIRFVPEDR